MISSIRIGLLVLGLSALVVPAPAGAEVTYLSDTGFIVENRVDVQATPEQVWKALVNDVGRWWPSDHTWYGNNANLSIDARANGCFCEIEGDKQAMHMLVTFVEPPRMLRMTGGLGPLQGMGMYGALDWLIESSGQGSRITLTYRVNGINPDGHAQFAPIVDQVQGLQLGGLATFLGSGQSSD